MANHNDKYANIDYPIRDSNLSFQDYIRQTRDLIAQRHRHRGHPDHNQALILDANSPFEYYPDNKAKKTGVLCLHGLLDSPFSWREIAAGLRDHGILCQTILLPGHGTQPADLLSISYKDWIAAMQYGIASMRKEVDHLFIAGYSTGGALAAWQALQDQDLAGIILLAPAIQVRIPSAILNTWQFIKKTLPAKHYQWINKIHEQDYTKYASIPFNAVQQVYALTEQIAQLRKHDAIHCPVFLAATNEDETVSARKSLELFTHAKNKKSQGILYAEDRLLYPDERITIRPTHYPQWHIKQISHVCLPFSPCNPHYGQEGDYPFASRTSNQHIIYGAYDPIIIDIFNNLFKRKLIKTKVHTLTYNPDFDHMLQAIKTFIDNNTSSSH